MSKGLKALKDLVNTMPLAFNETNSMREIKIIEKELKALEIIKRHLRIVIPINDTIEVFDIDLWNDGNQKEDFEFIRKVFEL